MFIYENLSSVFHLLYYSFPLILKTAVWNFPTRNSHQGLRGDKSEGTMIPLAPSLRNDSLGFL